MDHQPGQRSAFRTAVGLGKYPTRAVTSIDDLLDAARTNLHRLTPRQALAAQRREGALLVDTRSDSQRRTQGDLPEALVIDRTVLEWRLDPTCRWRIPEATSHDIHVIVICRQGFSSSLAAASLHTIGLHRATDVIGGVAAWLADDLPTHRGPVDIRH